MLFIKLLSRLPLSILYLLSDIMYLATYYIVRYRRTMVMKNLRNSFPEKSANELKVIEKQFYRNLADTSMETLKGITISKEELTKRVHFKDSALEMMNHLDKPNIIMTLHFSNWEWELMAFSCISKFEVHAVYQRLHSPFFDKLMLNLRSRFGAIMHEKKAVVSEISQISASTYVLALVSDQRPGYSERKYWATFLNQDAAFFSGSEIFARRLDIPVIYYSMHRVRRGYYELTAELITNTPQLMERNEITNAFIRLMERDIRKDPSSYLWSHNRWKHKKPTVLS